jgi:hypothetical protein
MIKTYVIETLTTEYQIFAIDLSDALITYDGKAEDIIAIKEYENPSNTDTIH